MQRIILISAVLTSLALASCSSEEHPAGHVDTTAPKTMLLDNLGSHHHAVTTSSEEAQAFFDQGLRLVYGFNHDEAERAFLEAARLDPKSAMAWWGVAVALGPNINLPLDAERNARAIEAVKNANALLADASQQERDYVAAISVRYSADFAADRTSLDQAYVRAMQELSQRYPDDTDAAVLYAESLMDLKPWQLWTADGKPQEGTETILSVLESVLARQPDHPGANHYYIHAIEASPTPGKGLASAERLRTLVPGAGHLVHMPAHIYIRTGDYAGAVEANANAARADEEYIAKTNAQGIYPMMYYTHNFMFLSAAAGMMGQSREALESAAKAVSIAAPMADHEPMVEYVMPWTLFALSRAGAWEDILNYEKPPETLAATVALWHYARGLAHIFKGNANAAQEERENLKAAQSKVPEDFALNLNRAQDLLTIASHVLDARIASHAGRREEAIASWTKAVALQDTLRYDEPPAWYYPVRESLGGEYLRAQRYAEAERVFRRDLEVNPKNPRAFFGLSEALRAQSKNADEARSAFEEAWKDAQFTLTVDML